MCLDGFGVLVTPLEILEADKKRTGIVLVLAVEQAVAVHNRDTFDGLIFYEEVTGQFADLGGAIQAGSVGHDHRAKQVALVFRWQERAGDALGHQQDQHDHAGKE
ncbi:hypothetical protein D3C71_1820080 [compost metagenome]